MRGLNQESPASESHYSFLFSLLTIFASAGVQRTALPRSRGPRLVVLGDSYGESQHQWPHLAVSKGRQRRNCEDFVDIHARPVAKKSSCSVWTLQLLLG